MHHADACFDVNDPVGMFLGRFYNASHYNSSTPNYDWWGFN
eukprot:COSAG01_NODE_19968_length_979_cov_0.854545_2_plen_40_part_01